MPYVCELGSIDPAWAVTIRSHATLGELPEIFESSFARLISYLEEIGEDIAGPPFAVYHTFPMDEFDMEMGLPVIRAIPGKDDIISRQIGIEDAASTIHTGPYEEIEAAYVALAEWINKNGHEPTGESYEFYLNDPGTTSPEDLQTIIFMPLKNSKS